MPTLVARQLAFSRFMMALIFLVSGASKLFNFSDTLTLMQNAEIWMPSALLPLAIALELLGGFALAAGYRTRMTALLLAIYLVPVTFIFHAFWMNTGLARQESLIHFLKNTCIIGGLLSVSFQQKVLQAFTGGTLIQLRRESFDRKKVA